jgi:hypothetical protein
MDVDVCVVVVYHEDLASAWVLVEKHVVLLWHILWSLTAVQRVYLLRQYPPVIVETFGVVTLSIGLGQVVLRLRNDITFVLDLVQIKSSYHLLIALKSCLRAQMMLMAFHALASSWVYTDFEFSALGVDLETLLLLDVMSKVIGSDLGEVLRVWHSIKTLP